jgi:UDP-GlcNAc:undecaprenyl-phosphate GlcNAc-1-phosphate transferase
MEVTKTMLAILFVFAAAISMIVTPLAIRLAPRIGAVDIPNDDRRMHTHEMPRFGGLAILAGSMIPILIFLHSNDKMMAAALGGTLIYLLGVLDDIWSLDAKVKFVFEIAVAVLMYMMGLRIRLINNYFGTGMVRFGTILCFVVTVIWLVGITNTINLVDGLDGLAAGLTMIASLCIAYVAYIHGNVYGMLVVSMGMVSVAGAAMGFLPYNFYPASIFMGDSGSLFLGFMLASMSVVGPLKRSTIIAVAVPVIVLGIPIFDTFFAIVRRIHNRRPIMEADKEHIHHHLIASGYGQRRAVLMLYGISAIMGMAAVLVSRELYKDAVVLAGIAVLYLYVFLTDPNHKLPRVNAVDIHREEEHEKRQNKRKKQTNKQTGAAEPEE